MVRRAGDVLLLLASDGLWDVFKNDEAAATAVTRFNEEVRVQLCMQFVRILCMRASVHGGAMHAWGAHGAWLRTPTAWMGGCSTCTCVGLCVETPHARLHTALSAHT